MPVHPQDIRAAIDALPVVDAHQHVARHTQCMPLASVTDFALCAYMGSMLRYVDAEAAARVNDRARDDRDRFTDFQRVWRHIACTGYGRVVAHMFGAVGVDDLTQTDAYERAAAHIAQRSPDASRQAYGDANIVATVTHHLGHPSCGDIQNITPWLAGEPLFDDTFHPLLGTLPLHEFWEPSCVEALSRTADVTITSLADAERAIDKLIERCVARGIVGFKDHAAYTRGLSFGTPDRAAAESELEQLLAGNAFPGAALRLSDYLFHHIVHRAADHDLPIAIHTGQLVAGVDPKANLTAFIPILDAYPNVRFDIYHLNYPWFDDLFAVHKRFPNTWANCCWTHMIDPAYAERCLDSALGTMPANHVFGFGGDTLTLPEPVIAHLDIARENIAVVLARAVDRKWCSRATAVDIARQWLHDSPAAFYRLPGAPA